MFNNNMAFQNSITIGQVTWST